MLNLECPDCGQKMIDQPSISPGVRLVMCYNQITKKGKNGNESKSCGYRGVYYEETQKIKPLMARMGKDKGAR